MRFALLSILCLMLATGVATAQIVTVTSGSPYLEDFNSNGIGTPTSTCPGTPTELLNNGWTNVQGELPTDNEWTPDSGGTSSGVTGPSVDADGSASGIYLYTETSGSCSGGDVAELLSPVFDVSGLASAGFQMSYHLFGATQGTLQVDLVNVTQATTTANIIPAISGDLGDTWFDTGLVDVGALLTSFADQFQILIRGISGTSFTSDMAIDNVIISEIPTNDVGIVSIDSPTGTVAAFAATTVSVTIQNFGLVTETSIPVEYDVDGLGLVQETYVGSIAPGMTDTFTFVMQTGFAPGNSTLNARTTLGTDLNPLNDAAAITVQALGLVNAFPYCEDFEAGDGGWLSGGTNNSWAYGMPAATIINSAASGAFAWVTNPTGLYNNSENSNIASPIFDCSTLTNPVFSCNIWYETENGFDECWLEMTTDGTTWTKVLDNGGATNWYNDTVNQWWENTSGGYLNASNTLPGAAGQPFVRLRFMFSTDGSVTREGVSIDDVKIFEPVFGMGQAPQPGIATLDVNNATEVNGFGVGSGSPGPYATTIANGSNYDIVMTGEANQAVVFFIGAEQVGALPIPPFGTIDINLGSIQVLGDGQNGTLIDSLFVLDGTGQRTIPMFASPPLAGAVISFQTINFNTVTILGVSNVVTATY